MPSLDESHRPSSHGIAIPKCALCRQPGSVREPSAPRSFHFPRHPVLALRRVRLRVGDDRWSSVKRGHTMSLSPAGDVMLERIVMLGAVALIAIGIATVFF
jgi:hypothetical protein